MKRICTVFLCVLVIAVSITASSIHPVSAAGARLFDIDPDCVETILVRSRAGAENLLHMEEQPEQIQEIIRRLNHFEYEKSEKVMEASGGTLSVLIITYKDGTEQRIDVRSIGAFAPDSTDWVFYYAVDPNYFDDGWMELLYQCPFTDLKMWYEPTIKEVYDYGLMMGTSEITFSPDAVMTRGMFITAFGRIAEIDTDAYKDMVFDDVRTDDYYFPYVSWAIQNNIIKGTSEHLFSSEAPVTNEQITLMLARFMEAYDIKLDRSNHTELQFTDIQHTTEEFKEKYISVYGSSLMYANLENNELCNPHDTLTRRQAADILTRAFSTFRGRGYLD